MQRLTKDPYGFFAFAPAEGLDLDLLDRVLVAARQEAGSVDVVVLPESAVEERDLHGLEAVLDAHGVVMLQTGVREPIGESGEFPSNWLHIGVNPGLEKGGPLPGEGRQPWFHLRQNKHHRWSLDEAQVEQYHLGSALHPHIRWWEAMDAPRKAVEFVETAAWFCADGLCPSVVGDYIAHRDRTHISETYAGYLSDELEGQIHLDPAYVPGSTPSASASTGTVASTTSGTP